MPSYLVGVASCKTWYETSSRGEGVIFIYINLGRSRRLRWLGRWSASLLSSISWGRVSPNAYSEGLFLAKQYISRKRESV